MRPTPRFRAMAGGSSGSERSSRRTTEREDMAAPEGSEAAINRALNALGAITYDQRDINLLHPYHDDIAKEVREYGAKNRDFREFVAVPELVTDIQQFCLEAPRGGLWKDRSEEH